jgi:phage-related protein
LAKTLADILLSQKNTLYNPNAWLILVEITLREGSVRRLCSGGADVTFGGETWTAFPFTFAPITETASGDLASLQLSLSNVTREPLAEILNDTGILDQSLTLRVVNEAYLNDPTYRLEQTFDILGARANKEVVDIDLGYPKFTATKVGLRVFRKQCNNDYKGEDCQFVDGTGQAECDDTYCDFSLEGPNGCRVHNNTSNFNGGPGIARANP